MDDKAKIALLKRQLSEEKRRVKQLTMALDATRAAQRRRRNAKIFPFEKLPAELRNIIYINLLVSDRVVAISRRRPPRSKQAFHLESHVRSDDNLPFRYSEKDGALLGTRGSSLLRANKAVLKEALPVLYGGNRFLVHTLPAFTQFIGETGPGVSHLRDISTCPWSTPTMHKVISLLDKIQKLEHFRVHVSLRNNTSNQVVNAIKKGLIAFVTLGDTEAERRRFFDIIRLESPACVGGDDAINLSQHGEDLTVTAILAKVKELLRVHMVERGVLLPLGITQ